MKILKPKFSSRRRSLVMSVEDDVSDGHPHNGDALLSPEDLSWVNSCVVRNPQLSDTTWDAMQDALLDILSSETPLGYNTPVAANDAFQRQRTVDSLMNEEDTQVTHQNPVRYYHIPSFLAVQDALRDTHSSDTCLGKDTSVVVNDEFQSTMDSLMSGETEVTQSPAKNRGEVAGNYPPSYLPNTESNLRRLIKGKQTEAAHDLSFTDETEFPLEDIFRVWDLNIPLYEEDELVKQLEFALGEGPLSTEPLVHDDSISDMDIEAVGDLISGIADLSLRPVSPS